MTSRSASVPASRDGADKLVWLYKCTPQPFAGQAPYKTKEGSNVTIQTKKIKFKATQRTSDHNMKIDLDSNTAGLAASVVTNWTKAVYSPADTKTVA